MAGTGERITSLVLLATLFREGQGAIGLFSHLGTLLVCVQLDIDLHL